MTEQQNNKATNQQIFRFREFPVYKEIRDFRKDIKQITKEKFPSEENFVLKQQLWRALDSIMLNLAEGSGRYSDIDFSRFLNLASTSLSEVVACLDAAMDDAYIGEEDHKNFLNRAESILKQLTAFSARVRKDNKRN